MKIVIDTNVLISGIFFGGFSKKVLLSVVEKQITACASTEIVDEYQEVIQEMIDRKQGKIKKDILTPLLNVLELIEPISEIKASRDPDDNKFIECAKDARALYIVSGDKDLLVLDHYENIEIVTAKEFCELYMSE